MILNTNIVIYSEDIALTKNIVKLVKNKNENKCKVMIN